MLLLTIPDQRLLSKLDVPYIQMQVNLYFEVAKAGPWLCQTGHSEVAGGQL